jgi:predicted AAA+ superfamily ATPase
MERNIIHKLLEWKLSRYRRPLLLQGARQVGKTWSLIEFGKKHYRNLVYCNFENNAELMSLFKENLNPERIIRDLSMWSGQSVFEEDTLIVFDEIQACDAALTALKYFNEDAPGYHVAAAGSLLGVAMKRTGYSFPVGQVDFMTMYPLDFVEFMKARGESKALDMIRESFESNKTMPLHQRMLESFATFLILGGMPRAVAEFIQHTDYNLLTATHKSITDSYIADMAKYAEPHETVRIMSAFRSIPAQLAKSNRKFQYKTIRKGARAKEFETAIDWLRASGIIQICHKTTTGNGPLIAFEDPSAFKVYLNDTGLLRTMYGIPPQGLLYTQSGFDQVQGAITENYVANALVSNGFKPYYWESQGKAEVDFVVQWKDGHVIPVEVKSSTHVRSKSLQEFINRYNPPFSIRISAKNFGFENNIRSVPLYAVHCLSGQSSNCLTG